VSGVVDGLAWFVEMLVVFGQYGLKLEDAATSSTFREASKRGGRVNVNCGNPLAVVAAQT
jgi:hypothetical protein